MVGVSKKTTNFNSWADIIIFFHQSQTIHTPYSYYISFFDGLFSSELQSFTWHIKQLWAIFGSKLGYPKKGPTNIFISSFGSSILFFSHVSWANISQPSPTEQALHSSLKPSTLLVPHPVVQTLAISRQGVLTNPLWNDVYSQCT